MRINSFKVVATGAFSLSCTWANVFEMIECEQVGAVLLVTSRAADCAGRTRIERVS